MPLKKLMGLIALLLCIAACSDTGKTKPAGAIPEAQLKALEKEKQHDELRKKLNEE